MNELPCEKCGADLLDKGIRYNPHSLVWTYLCNACGKVIELPEKAMDAVKNFNSN